MSLCAYSVACFIKEGGRRKSFGDVGVFYLKRA